MFSLICAWRKGWVINRYAGDLRCHRAHYDITVMFCLLCGRWIGYNAASLHCRLPQPTIPLSGSLRGWSSSQWIERITVDLKVLIGSIHWPTWLGDSSLNVKYFFYTSLAYSTKEFNPSWAKPSLKFNGSLAYIVKTVIQYDYSWWCFTFQVRWDERVLQAKMIAYLRQVSRFTYVFKQAHWWLSAILW